MGGSLRGSYGFEVFRFRRDFCSERGSVYGEFRFKVDINLDDLDFFFHFRKEVQIERNCLFWGISV